MSDAYSIDPQDAHGAAVIVTFDGDDEPQFDETTDTTQVPLEDGTVEISFGRPRNTNENAKEHDANLAEVLTDSELSMIAERLLLGIEQDISSRAEWLENMVEGISLLGLQIKRPAGAAASGGSAQEGTSTVDHPLLLEAVLTFQANARGELLPASGPVKVTYTGDESSLTSRMARALEKDLNHYLTKTAKEYYPDSDRMLFMLGFSGISFKKGYHDPIRRRPTINSIDAKDLIVSNAATDLDGSGRVTHRIMMRPSVLKRMQLLKAYRKVALPMVGLSTKNVVDSKIDEIQGVAPPTSVEAEDQDRELYECYCEIDIPGFEHELEGEKTGLPLPYRVTIDKDSRVILEIRRNWAKDDPFCLPINRIIAYVFIPGLGFYGLGLLNILGNATKAVTAAWRLMLDAGMFANFPGFLYLKSLAKQLTNQFRVPPGGGLPIDSSGINDIRSAVMPLPYKDPSSVFIQFIENISQAARRVGGITEMQVGEGRQDAPVGTTLALIEQATRLMSSVHKRLHQAQGQEFDMLKSLLMEDPEAVWRHNKKSEVLRLLIEESGLSPIKDKINEAKQRHRELFILALDDCDLTPAADPNTPSMTERYLKCVALRQMCSSNPNIDINKVDERAMRIMGIDDAEGMFKPQVGGGGPSPEEVMAGATDKAATARLLDSHSRAREVAIKEALGSRELDSRERVASLNLAKELVIHNDKSSRDSIRERQTNVQSLDKARRDAADRAADRAHKFSLAALAARDKQQAGVAGIVQGLISDHLGRSHDAEQAALARQHELKLRSMGGSAD